MADDEPGFENKKIDDAALDRLAAMRKRSIEQLNAILPVTTRKRTYTFAELYKQKDEEQRFLIPDLIPAGALTVLIGEDGIGKTQICNQICLAVAKGETSVLGLPLNVKHKRALFLGTEDSRQKFISAISKQFDAIYPGSDPAEVAIDFTEGSDFDDFADLKTELDLQLDTNFYDLIVGDALGDLFGLIDGDINDNSAARKLLSYFQHVCNERNTTIILIHHAAKSKIVGHRKEGKLFVEKNDSQGAGAITQKPRTILALTNDPKTGSPDGRTYTNYLHVVKANLMGKKYVQSAVDLQFDTATLLHRSRGTIDIEMMQKEAEAEGGVAVKQPEKFNARKSRPDQISRTQHEEICELMFRDSTILSREALINKMQQQYGVGRLKVEQKDGFLHHYLDLKIIVKLDDGSYKYNDEPPF